MTDQVPHPVKRERMERLVELVQRRARERAQRFVGRTMEVLVEGPSRTDPARLRGRTRHNKTVNFEGTAERRRAGRGRDHRRHLDHAVRATAERRLAQARDSDRARADDQLRPGDLRARPRSARPAVAIALAELLRERGEDPVAVSCDAIQVYRGLEIAQRRRRRPRSASGSSTGCVGFVDVDEEFSAGRFASWRTRRSTSCSPRGGGRSSSAAPGLYLRAALAELDLRPPVPPDVRAAGRGRDRRAGPGGAARRARPRRRRDGPPQRPQADRPALELQRAGHRAAAQESEELWTAEPPPPDPARRPDDRPRASLRADRRAGRGDGRRGRRGGGRAAAAEAGASRTARAALGFERAPRRRRRGGEGGPPRLRAPPAHLDAQDGGRRADRPHAAATTPDVAERDRRRLDAERAEVTGD